MAASGKRHGALLALRTRLQGITVANGYNTDAGKLVLWGEIPVLGSGDNSGYAVFLEVGSDRVDHVMEKTTYVLPVEVQIISLASPGSASYEAIEAALEDVKRAVETSDRTLGGNLIFNGLSRGPTRTMPRGEGNDVVGVGVMYYLVISEQWGLP